MDVVNKYTAEDIDGDIYVYVGRGTILGNQWSHNLNTKAKYIVSSREEAILEYEGWLWREVFNLNYNIINALRAIPENAHLVCTCYPLACHADVIVRVSNWLRLHPEFGNK